MLKNRQTSNLGSFLIGSLEDAIAYVMAMDPLPEEFVCVEPLFKRRLRMRQAAAPKETKAEIAQQRAKAREVSSRLPKNTGGMGISEFEICPHVLLILCFVFRSGAQVPQIRMDSINLRLVKDNFWMLEISFLNIDFHWFSSNFAIWPPFCLVLFCVSAQATERILIGHRPAEPAPQERPWLIEAAGNIFESTPVRSLSETTSQRLFLAVAPELEKKVLTEGPMVFFFVCGFFFVFLCVFILYVFWWFCFAKF